jgi:hypothetical protein
VFQPLAHAADDFAIARDDYLEASAEQNAEAAVDALIRAVQAADAVLSFLGFIEPYECGDCPACKARGAERRAEMEAAVEADPALSVKDNGPLMSPDEEARVRRLLADVFGPNVTPDEAAGQ